MINIKSTIKIKQKSFSLLFPFRIKDRKINILLHDGKTSDLDYSWPNQIDHLKPELNPCCFVMYVNCYHIRN